MYDKVKIYADCSVVGGGLLGIANYLSDGKEVADIATGETGVVGHADGMRVSVGVGGVHIVGSLPKFLYGSNVWAIDRNDTKDAISKLEDTLHIPLQDAKVTGLEFAQTFLMDREVVEYLPRLGTMPRMQRIQATPQSLYYKGNGKHSPKVLSFYDKEAEAKATGQDISTWVHEYGCGLLRYELRFNGRLSHQLKEADVCVSMLAQEEFYSKMVELYKQNYFSIVKQNNMETIVTSEIKKVSDAWDVWVARMMQQADTAQADEFMAELRRANVFKNKSDYTRLRKKMDNVIKKANVCVSDDLVKELDRNVEQCHLL